MRKKLSKRGKLYLVNGICFLFLAGMYIFRALTRQDTCYFKNSVPHSYLVNIASTGENVGQISCFRA